VAGVSRGRSELAAEAPDNVQDVHRRECLEVRIEPALVVVGPKPEGLHGSHPGLLRAAHILVAAVPDEERPRRVDAEPPQRLFEDDGVRLSLPGLGGEDRDIEALAEPHLSEIAMEETRRVEGVRDEPRLQPALAQEVEKGVRRVAEEPGRLPGRVLGLEKALELRVFDFDIEAPQAIADQLRVLDLLERAGLPEKRHVPLPKPLGRDRISGQAVAPDRFEAGRPPGLEEGVVVFETEERVAPVEKNRVDHQGER
jgi:hypothetical protein